MHLSPAFPERRRESPFFRREAQVYDQFARCPLSGFVLYEIRPFPHAPDLDFAIWLQGHARIPLQVKGGGYSLKNGVWRLHTQSGAEQVVTCPLVQTLDAAFAVKDAVKKRLRRRVYVLPVLVFPDMAADPSIDILAASRRVQVLWGGHDLVNRLIHLSQIVGIGYPPTAQDIREEVEAVTQGLIRPDLPDFQQGQVRPPGPMLIPNLDTLEIRLRSRGARPQPWGARPRPRSPPSDPQAG